MSPHDNIVVIGHGHASHAAAEIIMGQADKTVLIAPAHQEAIPFRSFHIPEMLKPEINNRRARRAKLFKAKRKGLKH